MIRFILAIVISTLFFGCTEKNRQTEKTVKDEVQEAFNDFYSKYENEDITFTDYYSEDVIRLSPTGEYTEGLEEFRKGWLQTIENDSFDLLGFGEPRFIISQEQVVSFNEFDEIFIEPESGDTTRYTGTWVAIWQKQSDNQWKIRMTTWHTNN